MTTYYPSQAGYAPTQPVMYANTAGYAQPYGVTSGYAPAGGVMYVPSHSSYRSRRSRRRNPNPYSSVYDYYSAPQVAVPAAPTTVMSGAPVVMVSPMYLLDTLWVH